MKSKKFYSETGKPNLILLKSDKSRVPDTNFIRIVKFTGLEYVEIEVDKYSSLEKLNNELYMYKEYCETIAMHGDTIVELTIINEEYTELLSSVFKIKNLFIYGINTSNKNNEAIKLLLNIQNITVKKHNDDEHKYIFESEKKAFSNYFKGLSFGPIKKEYDYYFDMGCNPPEYETLIRIDNNPFFIKIRIHDCNIFLLACKEPADIFKELEYEFDQYIYFSRIFPIMLYLKYVYKKKCWHSNNSFASLIIDDPLLKMNYGFLNYNKLLNIMDQVGFFSNIAFIPFNYNRNRSSTVNLIKNRNDRFMINIHGCDHTQCEFGKGDLDTIRSKAKISALRMEKFKIATGLNYDKVMVFPQGCFSNNSIIALKENNYLGAVNTTAYPIDKKIKFRIVDFLKPAVTKFYDYPLFLRRYPIDIKDFAFDLFLGKPAFIVIHHNDLKDGYLKLKNFIDEINKKYPRIRWKSVGNIIKETYLEKNSNEGKRFILQFSGLSLIANQSNNDQEFVIIKEERDAESVESVFINNENVKSNYKDNKIIVEGLLKEKTIINFRIKYKNYNNLSIKFGIIYKVKVYIRRYLSEFRDNFLNKSESLTALSERFLKYFS